MVNEKEIKNYFIDYVTRCREDVIYNATKGFSLLDSDEFINRKNLEVVL